MHDRPFHSPLQDPKRLLDVGCGTGTMTRLLGRTWPSAQTIVGIDLSPVHSGNEDATPHNVSFLQGDFHTLAREHPTLTQGNFDYIFSRMLVAGMTDWPGYIAQAKALLAPGGYLELQDLDLTMFDGDGQKITNPVREEQELILDRERGLDCRVGRKLEGYVRDAGFEDVQTTKYRWMYGGWEGHPETAALARYATTYIGDVMAESWIKTVGPRKTQAEIESAVPQLRDAFAWQDGKHHDFYVVRGRKAA